MEVRWEDRGTRLLTMMKTEGAWPRSDAAWLKAMKARRERVAMLTAYDAPTAVLQADLGVEVILVGDSVATTLLGYHSTSELTLAESLHHLGAVVRGLNAREAGALPARGPKDSQDHPERLARRPYVLGDLPWVASQDAVGVAEGAAAMAAQGADGVKFEGPHPDWVPLFRAAGVDAWGHLGYTPQTMAKPTLQGRDAASAERLRRDAHALAEAGVVGLILELVPAALAGQVSKDLDIPVIGIGAGEETDGQVQVWPDLVGLTPVTFRHAWRYGEAYLAAKVAIGEFLFRVRGRPPAD